MIFDQMPAEYRREAEDIPPFWITALDDIAALFARIVRRGGVRSIGTSAGGRPIPGVFLGTQRSGMGTSTFSGAIGCRNLAAYLGADALRSVYLAFGGVHASEFEGIAGIVNLVHLLETGQDLRGQAWPEITAAAAALDRIILIPVLNVDGRTRIPQRMFPYRGRDNTIYQCFATGAWADGSNIGWPACKEFIPLDFRRTMFPGGYPNDAGVNIQHDDFLGPRRQPETEAILQLCAAERPDLILNLHTGAPPRNYFTRVHRPYCEPVLGPAFDDLYRRIHTRLASEGLQSTSDAGLEADPSKAPQSCFNLDSALNLHCGALSVLIEAPCHAFSGTDRSGNPVPRDLGRLLDAQLLCHLEAMRFLQERGGRMGWAPGSAANLARPTP